VAKSIATTRAQTIDREVSRLSTTDSNKINAHTGVRHILP
jgi:hypothetical protein